MPSTDDIDIEPGMQVKFVCSGERKQQNLSPAQPRLFLRTGSLKSVSRNAIPACTQSPDFPLSPTPRYPLLGVVLATKPDFNITTWCLVIRIRRDCRVFVRDETRRPSAPRSVNMPVVPTSCSKITLAYDLSNTISDAVSPVVLGPILVSILIQIQIKKSHQLCPCLFDRNWRSPFHLYSDCGGSGALPCSFAAETFHPASLYVLGYCCANDETYEPLYCRYMRVPLCGNSLTSSCVIALSPQPPTPTSGVVQRQTIRQNLHFHVHC